MKHGDVVTVFEKLPDDERAYESRSTQDNDTRHRAILCATSRFLFAPADAPFDGPLTSIRVPLFLA
jgi:hypothetical protein